MKHPNLSLHHFCVLTVFVSYIFDLMFSLFRAVALSVSDDSLTVGRIVRYVELYAYVLYV